jgi:murein DD-endopeptidase MepM/ murein hydrolase activator NlpD
MNRYFWRAATIACLLALTACGWVSVVGDGTPPTPTRQRARAPVPAIAIDPGTGVRLVKVQPGDTVFGLSGRYGATPRQMIALNNLRPPFDIQVGQRLRLPPPQKLHRVRDGDTLTAVSSLYAADPSMVAANNHLTPPYILRTGEVLGIPTSRQQLAAAHPVQRAPVIPPRARAAKAAPAVAAPKSIPKRTPKPKPAPQARKIKPKAVPEVRKTKPTPKPTIAAAVSKPKRPPVTTNRAKIAPKPKPRGPAVATRGKSGGFLAPLDGPVIAAFGSQADGRRNDGVNIAAPKGTAVRAAQDGEVVYSGSALQGYGNLILVRHKNGWVTAYAHLDRILAKRGARVVRGETIGAVGTTGGVSAPQLHFEMRRKNKAVNPKGRLAAS